MKKLYQELEIKFLMFQSDDVIMGSNVTESIGSEADGDYAGIPENW